MIPPKLQNQGSILCVLDTIPTTSYLTLVWRRSLVHCSILCPPPLALAVDGRSNIEQPHHTSNNSISNDVLLLRRVEVDLLRKLKAESSIDNTERNDKTADPEMSVRPEHSSGVLLERKVVDETQERLDK